MNLRKRLRVSLVVLAISAICAVLLSIGVVAQVGGPAGLVDSDSRDANWEYLNVNDKGASQPEGLDEADEPEIISTKDGARYPSNRVLLTFDGSTDEQELCNLLSDAGVEVEQVSLVSKSLENNEVLVVVEYAGGEDPLNLAERLVADSVVSASEPDYVLSVDDAEGKVQLEPATETGESNTDALEDDVVREESLDMSEGADEAEGVVDAENIDIAANAEGENLESFAEPASLEEAVAANIDFPFFVNNLVFSPDATVNDTHYSKQWELAAAKLTSAWNYVKSSGAVTVAVIDTGIDYDHPDLKSNLVSSSYFKNTYTGATGSAAVDDVKGHGTHVAGIIAAQANNSKGVAGVSYNAKILPIKVSYNADGHMYMSDVIEAIDYAVSLKSDPNSPANLRNIRVINMSLGGPGSAGGSFQSAVNRATEAGILCVASAGNDASYSTDYYPAAYDGVLAVAALKKASTSAGCAVDKSYSNYGPYVDISAPGTSVYSTLVSNSYGYKSGTSMAAPVVSGTAALLYAQNMNLKPANVTFLLQSTAVDLEASGRDDRTGYGAVNAYVAAYNRPIAYCTFSSIPDQAYNGSAVKPKVTVKYGNATLVEGTDYTLSYSNNVNVGKATVIVTGKGRSAGSATLSFNIRKQVNMSNVAFNSATYTYDGEPHYLKISGNLPSGVSVSYSNNGKVNVGKHTVIARFFVDSSAYLPVSDRGAILTINPASILDCWAYTLPDQTYTGDQVKPKPELYLTDDLKLTEGVDYTLAYEDNVNVGEAWVRITGKGNFTGSGYLSFDINPAVERVAGDYAIDTSAKISSTAFDSSEWVVIARDDDFADAMSATGLAGALDCPIVLTDRYGLSGAAWSEIERLGATRAYVVGGSGAMPGDFEGELRRMGFTFVERVWGNESWDTSVECAKRIIARGGSSETSIVAMSLSFQDALSISSFAYKYEVPIYLQTQEGDRPLPDAAIEMIRQAGGDIYVPGGPGAVREKTVEGVFGKNRVVRLWGEDGYDTSNQIAAYMVERGLLSPNVVTIACGAEAAKGSDALSGAALAGRAGGVVLLANANERMEPARLVTVGGYDSQDDPAFLTAYADEISQVYVLGGAYVMPEDLVARIKGVLS